VTRSRAELEAELQATKMELAEHRAHLEMLIGDGVMALCHNEYRLKEETAAIEAIIRGLLTEQASDQDTERVVLDACLRATESKAALAGVLQGSGAFAVTATAGPLLDNCGVSAAQAEQKRRGIPVRGIFGSALQVDEPLICNDIAEHPDGADLPMGHIPIRNILGVPVKSDEEIVGLVAVANKDGGYEPADLETLSRLVAVMTVARRYRSAFGDARQAATRLEREVAERTAELGAVNRELESFAYSVSHDLRAPLRAIDGFSAAFIEDHWELVGPEGHDQLTRLRGGVKRMGRQIEDLLQVSRLATRKLEQRPVDLSALAREILEDLAAAEPAREVALDIAPGLVVRGDEALLRAAIQNLIGNAWKFTAGRRPARIQVGQEQRDGGETYFVRDNGAGFDMAFAHKLFGVFQRLHDASEFPGSGVGLATVQRVIHRHGGEVTAEGEVGRGAVFRFTLPGGSREVTNDR